MTDILEMADRRLSEEQLERARTELQAERLRDCLTCEERPRFWTPMAAAWIMSGIHPGASADLSYPQGWALLPGALAFYGLDSRPMQDDLSGWDALQIGVDRQLEAVGGLLVGTAPPAEWIEAAKAAGIRLPWVQFARADRECAEILPSSLFYEPGEDARPKFRKAQAVKGRARAKHNPSAKRIDGDGRRWFIEIMQRDPDLRGFLIKEGRNHRNKRAGEVNISDISDKMLDAIELYGASTKMPRNRIKAWLPWIKTHGLNAFAALSEEEAQDLFQFRNQPG